MPDRLTQARQFMQHLPHARALGMDLTAMGDGSATITMAYDPRFVGDPVTGVLHGGLTDDQRTLSCCGVGLDFETILRGQRLAIA